MVMILRTSRGDIANRVGVFLRLKRELSTGQAANSLGRGRSGVFGS